MHDNQSLSGVENDDLKRNPFYILIPLLVRVNKKERNSYTGIMNVEQH